MKYILIGLGVLILGFILWYFSSIVAYFIIASILRIIGMPVVDLLGKIQFRGFRIPLAIRSLITLILIWAVFLGFFRVFIPIVAREAGELANINIDSLIAKLYYPIRKIEELYNNFNPGTDFISFQEIIKIKIRSILDFSILTSFFGSLATILGNLFIALFSISFITFFLLKQPGILTEAAILLVNEKYEDSVRRALKSVRNLLTRYFIGLVGQIIEILVLVTAGMSIAGLNFRPSLLIGLTAGILNIIPYFGPLIGSVLGVIMGVAFHASAPVETLVPMMIYMSIVFTVVQLIDNILYQPIVFSTVVYAHPLEIFILLLMAGSIAGVTGMILAIPAYTILRVFAREFFNNFRVVQKLTDKIED